MPDLVGMDLGPLTISVDVLEIHSPTEADVRLVMEAPSRPKSKISASFPPCGFLEFAEQHQDVVSGEETVVDIRLLTEQGTTRADVSCYIEQEEFIFSLPTADLLSAVDAALAGSPERTVTLVDHAYSHAASRFDRLSRFAEDCRTLLTFEQYVALAERMSDHSPTFESIEYRGQFSYFTRMVGPDSPHSVDSLEDLEERIAHYSSSSLSDEVSVPEVLTSYLADNQTADARERILELGFDPERDDREYETAVPAGWFGHNYLTDGSQASEQYARNRPTVQGSYRRHQTLAENAEHGDRGQAWGKLLADAARRHPDDLPYVGGNMLYWTGDESRTKAPFPPMLHRAAREITGETNNDSLRQRAAVAEQLSLGHVNRRDRNWDEAQAAFERALELSKPASGFGFRRLWHMEVDALESLAIASDQLHRSRGEFATAISALEDAITEIRSMDGVREWKRESALTLLGAKRDETRGTLARNDGRVSDTRAAYERAIKQYESVEKDRSAARVRSKLDAL